MRLQPPLFQPTFPFVRASQWRALDPDTAHAQLCAAAQSLGGVFSAQEATALVLAVDDGFPAGHDGRAQAWAALLQAGLDPNARIERVSPDFGRVRGHEPAYFAAELEPFLTHGADPDARDFRGRAKGRLLITFLCEPERRTLEGRASGRYATDMRERVETWMEAMCGPQHPAPARRRRPGR